MKDCIFCKIVEGKIKSEKIIETQNVLSFLDINPKASGHSLVIPKGHEKVLVDINDDVLCEIFEVTKKVEKALKKVLNPDAFTIGINDGKAAGQEIPHFHVNVIPRFEDDGGRPIHSVVENPPKRKISEIADDIRRTFEPSE